MSESVRARGVPQHVVDKLDFPALPDGYFWQVWKPARNEYGIYSTETERSLPIEIRRSRGWPRVPATVVNTYERWEPTHKTLSEALSETAGRMFDAFVRQYGIRVEIDELWRKP